jgi:hypothetical protein
VRYFPGLLSANLQYIQTSPTLASRKNNTMNRVHSDFSTGIDRSVGMEFEEMAGHGDDSKRGAIRKDIQISQSWLDFSTTPHSSTTASVREFFH